MTDSAIADTLNRHVAQLIAERLDRLDRDDLPPGVGWQYSGMANALMGDNLHATDGDRAWLIGLLASRTPGVDFDGHPADCDWENLFSHLRAEILARRDPQAPSVREADSVRDGVGSR